MSSSQAPTPPVHQAEDNPDTCPIWLGYPSDGSPLKLFINQNSAIDFQSQDPDASVVASIGICNVSPNENNVDTVFAIGDTAYPVSGDQAIQY